MKRNFSASTKLLFFNHQIIKQISCLFALLLFAASMNLKAQTMGLMQHSSGTDDDGLVLFAPIQNGNTYLMDKCGKLIHTWSDTATPGHSVYFYPDGDLLRTSDAGNPAFLLAGHGGVIKKIDWNNNVVWSYKISDSIQCQHHDVRLLPNGNILAVVWQKKTKAEAIANGRRPNMVGNTLNSEKIIEIQPVGTDSATIVWEWNVWDHLVQVFDSLKPNYGVIADHPELVNFNYKATVNAEWLHVNSVDYNPTFNQIMICAHNLNEIWVIDHSTTTAEAASHSGGVYGKGGDLLYRWGNPLAYQHGTLADQKLFGMHNAHWITNELPKAGKIILFNNGISRPAGMYSSAEILTLPYDASGVYPSTLPYGPAAQDWIYTAPVPTDFFSNNISGATQLPNGNVLICSGQSGTFFEVDSLKNIKWSYINPVGLSGPQTQGSNPVQNAVFRCPSYPKTFAGFSGHTLTPGLPIEVNPLPYICDLTTSIVNPFTVNNLSNSPNPASDYVTIQTHLTNFKVQVYSVGSELVFTGNNTNEINTKTWKAGMYFIVVCSDRGERQNSKLLISR